MSSLTIAPASEFPNWSRFIPCKHDILLALTRLVSFAVVSSQMLCAQTEGPI